MDDVVVVIPALNEANHIFGIVQEVKQVGLRCIVVDDGSSDGTSELALAAGAQVIVLPTNGGNGSALKRGIAEAFSCGAKIVVTMDGDGAHQVADVAGTVRGHVESGADLTIGSRFLDRTKTASMPTSKIHANLFATTLFNGAMNSSRTDVASGFRVIGKRASRQLAVDSTFGWTFEFIRNCLRAKLVVAEAAIGVRYDARDPWVTSRIETVNFLDFITRECSDFHQCRHDIVSRLGIGRAFAVLGGGECFVLHPVRELDAVIFQRQVGYFRNQIGGMDCVHLPPSKWGTP